MRVASSAREERPELVYYPSIGRLRVRGVLLSGFSISRVSVSPFLAFRVLESWEYAILAACLKPLPAASHVASSRW
jgi:hypothetical protein